MKINILTFVLLLGLSPSARAEGFFINGDFGLNVFPNRADAANAIVYQAGAAYSSSSQSTTSFGYGVDVGQWLNRRFGWEIGYADFGNVTGYSSFGNNFGNAFGISYKYASTAAHAEILAGSSSGLFAKVGFYNASTKLSIPGQTISPHSNTGMIFGIGGRYPSDHLDRWAYRFGIDVYPRIKFTDLSDSSKATSGTITKIYLGEDYTF